MSKIRVLISTVLIGFVASAATGYLYGQSYAAYPLSLFGEHADLASDNNNNLHVIWLTNGTMKYGRIVGNAITGEQTIPNTTGLVAVPWSWPHLAVSPTGATVHVLWVGGDHKNLFHSWRNAAGTWTTETVYTSTSSQFYWPVCAVDAAENVHAMYGNSGSGNCKVYYTQKPSSGTWPAQTANVDISQGDTHLNVSYAMADFSEYEMYSDSKGGIHAKWSLINTNYLRYRTCASGGSLASSTTEYVLDSSATSVGPGDLHVEQNGTVHIGFNAYSGNVNVDHSYKPAGGSWSSATRARGAANTAHEIWPTIAAARDGTHRVFVAWAEGPSTVKLAVKDGSSWTESDLDIAAGMNNDWIKPAMTATNAGIYCIWRTGASSASSWVLGVIPTKTLSLTAPNGGEDWVRTLPRSITWSSNGLSGTVKLLLYQNLVLVGTIAQDLAVGTGSHSWTVGNLMSGAAPAGSNYKVRVQTTDNAMGDDSDGTFSILAEPGQDATIAGDGSAPRKDATVDGSASGKDGTARVDGSTSGTHGNCNCALGPDGESTSSLAGLLLALGLAHLVGRRRRG